MSARAATALAALIVAGCATLPPGALDRTIHGDTIEGRLSVHYTDAQTGREDASSGRFVWTTTADALELSLLDPLGQTVALIRSNANGASIQFRDGRRVEGSTPESLTQQTLGWTVPLRGLGWWLDGRTDPSSPVATLDDGRLRQDGWTIRFARDDGAPPDAPPDSPPKRIDLSYPGPPAAIDLRLVVDDRSGP